MSDCAHVYSYSYDKLQIVVYMHARADTPQSMLKPFHCGYLPPTEMDDLVQLFLYSTLDTPRHNNYIYQI